MFLDEELEQAYQEYAKQEYAKGEKSLGSAIFEPIRKRYSNISNVDNFFNVSKQIDNSFQLFAKRHDINPLAFRKTLYDIISEKLGEAVAKVYIDKLNWKDL